MSEKIIKPFPAGLSIALVLSAWMLAVGNSKPVLINEDTGLTNALDIPPILEPVDRDGTKVFALTLQQGRTEFLAGTKTATWGANGTYLMPTIRAAKGDDVEVQVTNQVGERTTVHWHGMHLPPTMDGVHQIIEPRETWRPHWEIRQQAATLWYHPHLMGVTGPHVYYGLAGLFIIEDSNSEALDLPDEYGVDDIPLIVQDRKFDEAGQFVYRADAGDIYGRTGMLGDTILVNGTHAPFVEVPGRMIRLRILNASNARRYSFGFSDDREFYQIASDGGFLERPVARTRMMLAVAERAEILVDMSDLETATLMSYEVPTEKGTFRRAVERLLGARRDENDMFKILEIRPRRAAAAASPLPERLNSIERWSENEAVQTREFVLGRDSINSLRMEPGRIDEVVMVGTKETWEITNPSGSHHPFHVHDVQFQILDRDGRLPPEHERGWKDTVFVDEDETVRVMMEFKDYVDPHVPYMYHCHILEHEDHGMMGQFVVVEDSSARPEVRTEALAKGVRQRNTGGGH